MIMRTTKEQMIERFRLYGEIYCMMCEAFDEDDTMDYIKITASEIQEMLEDEDVDLIMDFDGETGELHEINFENEMMMVWYIGDEGCCGWQIIKYSTETIRKIMGIIERYIKAMKEEGV